jgi:hypothetical protein
MLRRSAGLAWWGLLALLAGPGRAAEPPGPAGPDRGAEVADHALQLEAKGLALLRAQYAFEHDLLAARPDRLSVFLSLPAGGAVTLDEVAVLVDGQPVVRHRYAPGDLSRLAAGAIQPLYAGPLAAGEHSIRLEVKTRQGKVLPMQALPFSKGERPRVVEFQLAGETTRQIRVNTW